MAIRADGDGVCLWLTAFRPSVDLMYCEGNRPMAILVVGGAGYIGSHAARMLRRQGHEVIIYDNLSTGHRFLVDGFELIVGDIANRKKLAASMARAEAV